MTPLRTWRGKAARINWYFLEGTNALTQIKQVIYISAALKLLGLELTVLIALAPVLYVLHVVAGYCWVRFGWYKQLSEVPTTDAVSPIMMWQLYMNMRLYQHFNLPLNDMDVSVMPKELHEVLSSYHKKAGTHA